MTKTAMTTSNDNIQGHRHKPQSLSRMKKWLASAAIFAGALLVEPLLNTSGYSSNQVFTVGRPALAQEKTVKPEEHITNAKAAILNLERKKGRLNYNSRDMQMLLGALSGLGKVDGSTPKDQYYSLFKTRNPITVAKFKSEVSRINQMLTQQAVQKRVFSPQDILAKAGEVAAARSRALESIPAPVAKAPRRIIQDESETAPKISKATPKPAYTGSMPEFRFNDALVQASLPAKKTVVLRLLEELKDMVTRSDFGTARLRLEVKKGKEQEVTLNVKNRLLSHLDGYIRDVKGSTNLEGLGVLYDSLISQDALLINLAVNVRKSLTDREAIKKLDGAMMRSVVAYGVHKRDPVDAAYDIADALKQTFTTTTKEASVFASALGASWFIRDRFNMSLNDYNKKSQRLSSGDAKEKMKLGQAHLSEMVQHAESTIQWAETHIKLRMDKAKSVLQTAKSGKATDPVRMARDLHAAVLGPLVFATADEFIKDGKSFRTDLSKGELALVKRNLASSLRQARMIYDWEFTRGLNRTLYPELPSDIILRALSIASGPEAVVLENGIFRDLTQSKDLQNEKDGNLLNYFQKQAITCIAISSIAPTRFSKLLDSIGYNAAHAMVGEYVAGDIKNWPIHRAGANTAVSDRDEFRGGMLFSELTTMRTDKHMKRVRDHGYSYPRVNFWANPILLTNKAIEAALEIPLGEALSGKKPGELPASDVARLQTAYTKQIGLQNTIYLELINGLRAALKNEQGIDFASLDKKIKTAQSPVAKRYYQRARYFLALVNDLSGVMKKNISKDLTSGTVPGLYANPHRTFELLHGVMASAQDGDKAERDGLGIEKGPVKTKEVRMLVAMSDTIYDPGQDIKAMVTFQSKAREPLSKTLPGEKFELAIFDRIDYDPLTKKRIWYALGNDKDRGVGTIAYLGDEETRRVYNKVQKKSEERTFGNVYVFIKRVEGRNVFVEAENYRAMSDKKLENEGVRKIRLATYEVMKTTAGIEAPVIYRDQIPKGLRWVEDAFWFKWNGDDMAKKTEPWMKNLDLNKNKVEFPVLPASPASKNRRVKGVTVFRSL